MRIDWLAGWLAGWALMRLLLLLPTVTITVAVSGTFNVLDSQTRTDTVTGSCALGHCHGHSGSPTTTWVFLSHCVLDGI